MMNSRHFMVASALVAGGIVVSFAASSSATNENMRSSGPQAKPELLDINNPPVGPTNTAPDRASPTPIPNDIEGTLSGSDKAIVTDYAKRFNLSIEDAAQEIIRMAEFTEAADAIRQNDESYAGFRITGHGGALVGELALSDASVRDGDVDPQTGFTLRASRVPESEFLQTFDALTQSARKSGLTDVSAVTYDPFDDALIAWSDVEVDPASVRAGVETALRSEIQRSDFSTLSGLPLQWEYMPDSGLNYGGIQLKVSNPWYFAWLDDTQCTSGFGSWGNGVVADLTAGHCEGTGWKQHTSWAGDFNVTGYFARSKGGYKDRVFMQHGVVSYWTWTGTYGWQDMDSLPRHIFQGSYYCHYSRKQYGTRCGLITQVNVPVTASASQGGFTVFTTRGEPGMKCKPGDSGGPVFQPVLYAPYWPAGTIEAGSAVTDECLYLALDDQFAGSGWVLL